MKNTVEEIAAADGRYSPKALGFVHEGVGQTIERTRQAQGDDPQPRHITGAELAKGLAKLSIKKWGRLSRLVLDRWGITSTRDWGEIVYLMIEHKLLTAQESDRVEDFDNVYDFKQVFEKQFKFDIK